MLKASCIFILVAFCGALSVIASEFDVDVPEEVPDEPFEITAGRIEYTNETVMADGNVTGRFERAMFTADTLSGNTETGDLRMEGNIHFERDNVIWNLSELDYNYMSETGNFGRSTFHFEPILLRVDHMERVSTNQYLLKGADFTTCDKEKAHYHVRAKEAQLIDEKYLTARNVTVYAGKVPILYLPYWRQELEKSIFSLRAGYGSEWGAYGLVKATVPVTTNVDWITDLNLYSKRGVGFGQGFSWELPQAEGEFAAFYIKDDDPYSRFDSPEAEDLIGQDRYRFKFEHIQRFSDEHYVNTKVNDLSDPAVLEEFFKSEYRKYTQPENYLSYVYANSYIGSEAFINHRLDSFYDNTDRYEYSFDFNRSRIADTPFYFQSENSFSSLEQVYSKTNKVDSAYDARRIDSYNMLTMPKRVGFLNLVPRATYRATYYSDTDPAFGGSDEVRHIPGAGVEASFQATKVLSERERWYGKGLRHKVEPYTDYIYEDASDDPDELLQFDEIDELQDENKMKLGLRNVLQTKRDGRVSRFIELDLYTFYLFEDHGTGNDFDSLFIDARMPLTKRWMVDIEGEFDWNEDEVPFFDTRLRYDRDDIVIGFEHLYQDDIQSLWTTRVDLFPDAARSYEAFVRYDDRNNDVEEVAVISYFNKCCMRYGIGYHFYDNSEHRFMLSVGLSAFPGAKISSGL